MDSGAEAGTARSLARGSAARALELLTTIGAALLVTPLAVNALGERLYGFWTLGGAVVGYLALVDFGLSGAATRFLSQARGRGDDAELEESARTAVALFCVGAAVVGSLSVAGWLACSALASDAASGTLLGRLILVLGLASAVGFPAKACAGLLAAELRYDLVACMSIGRTVVFAAGVWLSLRAGLGLFSVAASSAAASLLQGAALWAACRMQFPSVRLWPPRFEGARMAGMLGYGWKSFAGQVGDVLRFRLDPLVIGTFLSVGSVTPYAVGARLAEAFCQLVFSAFGMMMPVFSRYEGRGDHAAIRSSLLTVTRLATIASTFVGLSVVFYAGPFIERWIGTGYEAAAGVAGILSAGFMLALPHSPGVQLLYGLSRHKVYAAISIGEGVLNLALTLWLIAPLGLYGVALGTTAAMAIVKVLQPLYVCRVAGVSYREYVFDAMLVTGAKTALPLGLFFLAVSGFVRPSYPGLAACAAAQTALFLPVAYAFVLRDAERRVVLSALRAVSFRSTGSIWRASTNE